MNSKTVGAITVLTGLTTVLNFIKVPAPYLPTFSYSVGDITIVVAFLLFGAGSGVLVALLSTIITMFLVPGPAGFIGPPYYFVGVCAMLAGLFVAVKLFSKSQKFRFGKKTVVAFTLLSVLSRTFIMLPLDYLVYGALVSFVSGLSMQTSYAIVAAAMPGIVLYNITVPLYVIPTSYFISKKLAKPLKTKTDLFE